MNLDDFPVRDRNAALAKLGGREALLAKLEKSFLRDAPANLERLEKALADADLDELSLVAHKMKGEANTVGARRLGWAAQRFHEAARAKDADALPGLFPGLAEQTRIAMDSMRQGGGQSQAGPTQ